MQDDNGSGAAPLTPRERTTQAAPEGASPGHAPPLPPEAPRVRPHERPGFRATAREFLIIVAGVLAALGAQALWEWRQDRELERTYLEQLRTDAEWNLQRVEEAIASDSSDIIAATHLLLILEGNRQVSADSIMGLISQIGSNTEFQPVTGTHRALLATGDIRVVRNHDIRTKLTSYATTLDRESARNEQLRGALLDLVPHLARALPFMRTVFAGPVDTAAIDMQALLANEEASAIFFAMQATASNRISGLRNMRTETQAMLDALAQR